MNTATVTGCAAITAVVLVATAWAIRCLRRLHREYLDEIERDRLWDEEHQDG